MDWGALWEAVTPWSLMLLWGFVYCMYACLRIVWDFVMALTR